MELGGSAHLYSVLGRLPYLFLLSHLNMTLKCNFLLSIDLFL